MRLRIKRIKNKTDLAKDVCCYLLRHAWGTNAILNGVDPITVAFSRRVGQILKVANTKDPALHYRYYM